MTSRKERVVALTIAGSDSGGGAGIQADLKTFAALGVHGTSAITCLTAQNPGRVAGVHVPPAAFTARQIEAVFGALPPAAAKTGMLYSPGIVRVVAEWFSASGRPPLVVDPVMLATSGASLSRASAVKALAELLPLAALTTPNLDEAGVLMGGNQLGSVEDMRYAARRIHGQFGCPVLVKGGHLRGLKQAVDVLFDGQSEYLFEAPYVKGVSTHGTGCTYSAAITAHLARGDSLVRSVQRAKEYVTRAIAQSYAIGRHQALAHFA